MAKLLIDVIKLDKEGLVGFTEIGEEIPLKEIESDDKTCSGKLNNSEIEEYLKARPKGEYVYIKELSPKESEYHLYQERK